MSKLTETEGHILAELLLKLADDEKLANELVDIIADVCRMPRSLAASPVEQESTGQFFFGVQ